MATLPVFVMSHQILCDIFSESPTLCTGVLRFGLQITALTLPHALGLRVCAFLPSESLSSQLCIPGCVGGYAD